MSTRHKQQESVKIVKKERNKSALADELDNFEFPTDTQKIERTREMYHDDGSNKAFIDYDPEKDTRKYPVYRNDIKFRKHRGVDPSRAEWDDDVKQDYQDKDTDSIEYRLEECKREKNETLDLSHMQEDCFEQLFSNKTFLSIRKIIQHIFAKDCNIRVLPNLSGLISLQTLDVSCNKLKKLPELPESLEELIVNDNRLSVIDNDLPKLLRFNGSDNMLTRINYSNSLERVHIKNNPIDVVPKLSNLYFLDASITKVKKIHPMPKLKYLDISFTEIMIIPDMPCLEHLQCNESSVNDISIIKSLHSLEIVNAKIDRIHYMPNLYTVTYHDSNPIKLSKQFKIMHAKKNRTGINEITFNLLIENPTRVQKMGQDISKAVADRSQFANKSNIDTEPKNENRKTIDQTIKTQSKKEIKDKK